jgi:glycerol-3-phosphate O-acyltransferase
VFERLGAINFLIVRRLLSAMTRPGTRGEDNLDARAPMVYVLQTRSLTDLAMLDIIAAGRGLPRPRESLVSLGVPERQRYFFLTRGAGWLLQRNVMRVYPRRLQRLQNYFRATRRADLCLVPVSIFWGRAPSKERSLIRVLLSENWTITSRFRRLVVILFNRRDITVQFGTPLRLGDIDDGSLSEAKLARRIARHLRVAFKNQRTAFLGPDLSHRRTLVLRITRSHNVREAIRAEAKRSGEPEARVARRARKEAFEIASDVSYVTIRFFDRLLTAFWNKVYDGLDFNGIDRIAKLAETSTLVYVPCHRSHVDYLVLSYLLYYEGLAVPHIAAGDNLNMPLIGPLLRHAGAFFMRRRFADDRLYTAVFTEYLHQVFQRGFPVKYFIEGGRSRTGRPLPPRTGLLGMTLASHARGVRRPLVLVPVYIGYERVIEARSYLSELQGTAKTRESIADILRTLKLLREHFGRVHVNIGEPIPLPEFLANRAPDRAAARELGVEILRRINACADVNSVNLVSLVLLNAPRLAMDEQTLADQVECFAALLRAAGGGVTVTTMTPQEVVAHVESLGFLRREHLPFGDVLSVDTTEGILLTWYRNNVLHTLALPGLLACLIAYRRRPLDLVALDRMAQTVYPYLASELFVAVDDELSHRISAWIDRLSAQGLLRRNDAGQIWAAAAETHAAFRLEQLAAVVMPILQRFYIVVAILERAGSGTLDRATLEARCQALARRISRLYGLNAPEFFDARLFHGFVDTLIARQAVHVDALDRIASKPIVSEVVRAAAAVLPVEFRHAVLRGDVAAGATQLVPSADVESGGAADPPEPAHPR